MVGVDELTVNHTALQVINTSPWSVSVFSRNSVLILSLPLVEASQVHSLLDVGFRLINKAIEIHVSVQVIVH